MWDQIIKGLIAIAASVVVAEVGSKLITGKWAHEHLYEWWRQLSERIDEWVKNHQEFKVARVVAWVNCKLDDSVVALNRIVRVSFFAHSSDSTTRPVVIEEVELQPDEVREQFPELRDRESVDVLTYSYGASELASKTDGFEPSDSSVKESRRDGGNPSGTYRGTCFNTTCNLGAELVLSMMAEGERVSGKVIITGDLVGSAPFSGVRKGNTISFVTTSQDGAIIAWVGTIDRNRIMGGYAVEIPSEMEVLSDGEPRIQKGIWSVTRY